MYRGAAVCFLLIVSFSMINSTECYTQEDNRTTLYLSFIFGLHFPLVLIFIISYYCVLKPCVRRISQKQSFSSIGNSYYPTPSHNVTINPAPTYIPNNITSTPNQTSLNGTQRTSRYAATTHNVPGYARGGPPKPINKTAQRLPLNAAGVWQPSAAVGVRQPPNVLSVRQPPNTAGVRQPPYAAVGRQPSNVVSARQPPNAAGVRQPLNAAVGRQHANATGGRQPPNATVGRQYANAAVGRQPPSAAGVWPGPSKRAPGHAVKQTPEDHRSLSTEHLLLDVTLFAHHVKALVYRLWKMELVGIGRDAHSTGLRHIKIIQIQRNKHTPLLTRYKDRKRKLKKKKAKIEFMESLGELTSSAVETTDFLRQHFPRSELIGAVAADLNEHYLFHGTTQKNVNSICRNGLMVNEANIGMFGKGIYFAENPTKADQYTDISGDKVIFLMRVCLGELYIHTAGAASHFTSPPCRECHTHGCTEHQHKYDSAVACLPRLNFREFVVYRNYRAYPEYVITYRRTHDSSEMDSFRT